MDDSSVLNGLDHEPVSVQNSDGSDTDARLFSQSKRKSSSKGASRELKLVYRTLRLISDWVLPGFFSEVSVEGTENVRSEGALILTPCHHNEIIDIATLSATIPHRRIIAYWAKASLFKNPISRFIVESAGAIPVARAPRSKEATTQDQGRDGPMNGFHNGVSNGTASPASPASQRGPNSQQALFEATYRELAKPGGSVLGVFPEGTSYTLPRIVQVKEGAARAALGYIRWIRDCSGYGATSEVSDSADLISIFPVGIVYTDKSHYRSRVYVKYGTPIDLRPFVQQCLVAGDDPGLNGGSAFQDAVRQLTEEIEKAMLDLTINTSSWETLYATRTSRAILWPNERDLPLSQFVKVSKVIVAVFDRPTVEVAEVKSSLLRYHALLYHTGLTHAALIHVPFPPTQPDYRPDDARSLTSPCEPVSALSLFKLAVGLPRLSLPPLLSLPAHLAHTPAYALASLTSQAFAGEEEEGRAQFKAIFGGVGRAVGTFATGFALMRSAICKTVLHAVADTSRSCLGMIAKRVSIFLPSYGIESIEWIAEKLMGVADDALAFLRSSWLRLGGLGDWIGAFGIAWLLIVWHSRVIDSNYIRYKRIRATLTILRALLFSRRVEVTEDDLRPYLATPPPPVNPFIAKSLRTFLNSEDGVASCSDTGSVEHTRQAQRSARARRKVSKSTLVRQLLLARADAVGKVHSAFRELEERDRSAEALVSCNEIADREARSKVSSNMPEDIMFLRECGADF